MWLRSIGVWEYGNLALGIASGIVMICGFRGVQYESSTQFGLSQEGALELERDNILVKLT